MTHHGHHSTILPTSATANACTSSLSTFQPVQPPPPPHHFNSLDYRERNQTHYKHGQGHQQQHREPTQARTSTLDRRSAGATTASTNAACIGDYNQISPHYLQTFDSLDPYGVANLHLYRSQSKSQIYGRGSASGSGSGSNDGSTHDAVLYHSNSTLNHYQQQQQQQQASEYQHYQAGGGQQRGPNQAQQHHHSLKHSKSSGSKSHKNKTSAHQQQQNFLQQQQQQQQQKPTKSRSSRSLPQQSQSQHRASAVEKASKMLVDGSGGAKECRHNSKNSNKISNISKANSMTSQYSSSSESVQCDNNYY
ncbi:putative mediator of RNA polymerase II transcription subunit 12 [Ceratitis capitata]|nr:putative mediator of RNA polymerase II transcription subunit 12 [Ceratitis capitata]